MTGIGRKLTVCVALAVSLPVASVAMAQIITSNVTFARGSTSSAVNGVIVGGQTRDYVVRASAGQTLRVSKTGSPIVFFNVLPPGSNDVSIFTGSNDGNSFSGTLSASGAYKIRVYQMRATARNNQRGPFRLNISVTGRTGSGSGSSGGLQGIAGMNSIAAIDAMTSRGFRNVDSLESGNTQYGIFFNGSTRVCAQLTMADGKVLDAKDIKTHPKCR